MAENKIHSLMPVIASEIGPIGKDQKNKMQNYNYRGINDLVDNLSPILAKHGVYCIPEVLEHQREVIKTQKGTNLIFTMLTVKYTAYAPDGSSVSAIVMGEGMDSGDKSTNKAMTAAYKYFIGQVFAVAYDMVDSEVDSPNINNGSGNGKSTQKPPAKKTESKEVDKKLSEVSDKAKDLTEKLIKEFDAVPSKEDWGDDKDVKPEIPEKKSESNGKTITKAEAIDFIEHCDTAKLTPSQIDSILKEVGAGRAMQIPSDKYKQAWMRVVELSEPQNAN